MREWATGNDLPDTIDRTAGGVVWGSDSSFFYYVERDDNHRPLRVFRHRLGTPQADDVLVHEEKDTGWFVSIGRSSSGRFGVISGGDHDTSEQWLIDLADPAATPRLVEPRVKGVRYVAACDVDARHLKTAVEKDLPGKGDKDAKGFKDFRELLDRKDIQAVTIATPDQWHALVAIDALKKGKDVYLEKPLTLTIGEAVALGKVVEKTGRVLATGSQQRSDARFRLACELVRNGRIGKLKHVTAHLPTGPVGGPFEAKPVPADLDYDFWLGPAPEADYFPEHVHGNFRWMLDYSGGMLTDWGAHHNDISQWGIGADGSGDRKSVV